MTRNSFLAACMMLAAVPGPALAQKTPAAPAASPVQTATQDQKDHAVQTFQLLAAAMASDKIPNDVKSVLMSCMYDNSIGNISATVDSALTANPGKVDRTKPDEMVGVIAAVCGYRPPDGASSPAPRAPSAGAAKGR